jgi:hypothetical protein
VSTNGKAALDGVKPKMIGATLGHAPNSVGSGATVDAKRLGDEPADDPNPLGAAIERALALADLTKQEASYRMGYRDQSSLSKWIAGTEPPRFDKLWKIRDLRRPLLRALAMADGLRVRETISFEVAS